MVLRCGVCKAVQAVTTADEVDEDPRTRSIRQAFRAAHVISCGSGSVRLLLYDPLSGYEPPDPECWTKYLDSVGPIPSGIVVQADGLFSRLVDGVSRRVCEGCWAIIPPYRDYPFGLTSPESDGAGGTVPKLKVNAVDTENRQRAAAAIHIRKAVCVPCYAAAFARVYPDAPAPDLNEILQPGVVAAPIDQEDAGQDASRVPRVAAPKPEAADPVTA